MVILPFLNYCKCCILCCCCLPKHLREKPEEQEVYDPLEAAFDIENVVKKIASDTARKVKTKEVSQFDRYVEAAQSLIENKSDWSYKEMCEVLDLAYQEPAPLV